MIKKNRNGKQVYNKFIARDSFISQEAFESEIREQVSYLEKAWWLYESSYTGKGIVKVHRNKRGARIIAYDYKKS